MLLRRRLIAANVGAVLMLALAWAATSRPVRIESPQLPPGPVVVRGFEVADDLSTARVNLAIRTAITTDAGVLDGSGLTLPLRVRPSDETRAVTATLRHHGQVVGRVTVEYYARSLYERIGSTDPGYVLLVTDLPRQGLERETVANVGPIDATVVAIASAEFNRIEAINQTSSGRVCSDESSGPELTAQIASGECFVWCTGRAIIVRDALRTAGFEARVVGLVPDRRTLPTGVIRLSSEEHATVEYRGRRGWQWIGPTHGVHAGGMSIDAFLSRRDASALVRYAGAEDLTSALERYLTADKLVVPEE